MGYTLNLLKLLHNVVMQSWLHIYIVNKHLQSIVHSQNIGPVKTRPVLKIAWQRILKAGYKKWESSLDHDEQVMF